MRKAWNAEDSAQVWCEVTGLATSASCEHQLVAVPSLPRRAALAHQPYLHNALIHTTGAVACSLRSSLSGLGNAKIAAKPFSVRLKLYRQASPHLASSALRAQERCAARGRTSKGELEFHRFSSLLLPALSQEKNLYPYLDLKQRHVNIWKGFLKSKNHGDFHFSNTHAFCDFTHCECAGMSFGLISLANKKEQHLGSILYIWEAFN